MIERKTGMSIDAPQLTMRSAVELLGIDADTRRSSVNIMCPICGKPHEKKLNINFDKSDGGVFRCAKCGVAGKPLHFWALFRGLDSYDITSVAKDYYAYIKGNTEKREVAARKREPVIRKDVDIAPIEIRDMTYRKLLSLLPLRDSHRQNLIDRGFSDEAIEKGLYKSYPQTGLERLCKKLLSEGFVLEGVPGFYLKDSGEWSMIRMGDGFIIPQKNSRGQIQGCQLRLMNSSVRYLTLSTGDNYKCGSKGRAYCHFSRGSIESSKIILTEGPLKADAITELCGYSVIAIQGVNAVGQLPNAIAFAKESGVREVLIAFDMDIRTNEQVNRALLKMKALLNSYDMPFRTLYWGEEHKGLDDWLLHSAKNR